YGHNINGTIQNNTLVGSGYGLVLKGNGLSYKNGGVFNNKFYNCLGGSCIRIKGIQNVSVMNNFAYNDKSLGGTDYQIVAISQNNTGENGTGNLLENNVFIGAGLNGSDLINVDSSSIPGFVSDFNDFLLPSFSNNLGNINNVYYPFFQWQSKGYDTHSVFF